jgi:hypothetical protein
VYQLLRFVLLLPFAIALGLIDKVFFWTKGKGQKSEYKRLVLSNIIAGWSNLAFPDPQVEALAKKRAEICASCPFAVFVDGIHTVVKDNKTENIRGLKCGKCGCPLSAKVRAPHDSCPEGRW